MYDNCGNSLFLLMMVDRLLVRNVADGYSMYNHSGCDATKFVETYPLVYSGNSQNRRARVERLQVWPIQKAAPSAMLNSGSAKQALLAFLDNFVGKKTISLWWWSLPSSWFWEILSD